MHRSRVSTLLIDVPRERVDAALDFWTAALGVETSSAPGEPEFTTLHGAVPSLVTAVQSVDAEPRYHLDIETDDVDAEHDRLLALGAVDVGRWLGSRTLRVPGGHLVCVIPVHSDPEEFRTSARLWP
ncbi:MULTISPECIES: VOC family protein [unclassified Actinotalea]|uniref:VOC family protein n=1 Tax=unclassified Actinotalea TaxID=2638618 RepID=UPI0015F38E63|nr:MULTISPECIES: VOC family protein [unclassified Actinotalea]